MRTVPIVVRAPRAAVLGAVAPVVGETDRIAEPEGPGETTIVAPAVNLTPNVLAVAMRTMIAVPAAVLPMATAVARVVPTKEAIVAPLVTPTAMMTAAPAAHLPKVTAVDPKAEALVRSVVSMTIVAVPLVVMMTDVRVVSKTATAAVPATALRVVPVASSKTVVVLRVGLVVLDHVHRAAISTALPVIAGAMTARHALARRVTTRVPVLTAMTAAGVVIVVVGPLLIVANAR